MRMSAQEFVRWGVYYDAEGIGPDFDRARYAQRRADTLNAGHVGKQDKSAFTAADFRITDPWRVETPTPEPTFQQIVAQTSLLVPEVPHG